MYENTSTPLVGARVRDTGRPSRVGTVEPSTTYAFPLPACTVHTYRWEYETQDRDKCYRCGAARPNAAGGAL